MPVLGAVQVTEQLRMFHANESEQVLVSYACLVLVFGQQILYFGLVQEAVVQLASTHSIQIHQNYARIEALLKQFCKYFIYDHLTSFVKIFLPGGLDKLGPLVVVDFSCESAVSDSGATDRHSDSSSFPLP